MNIVFFGDSIFNSDGVSVHKNWIVAVSKKLEDRFPDVVTYNFSVSGDTTSKALDRMAYHIKKINPTIFVTQFGINDCNYWESEKFQRVGLHRFEANMSEILLRSIIYGAKKVITLTNVPISTPNVRLKELRSYNDVLRSFNWTSTIIDIESYMISMDLNKYILEDGIHLSELGHTFYEEKVYPVIENAIIELK